MAVTLSLQECALLEQVLTHFLDTKGHNDIRPRVQELHAKMSAEVVTSESVSWDKEKITEESPEL
jgi:hypothetical protein